MGRRSWHDTRPTKAQRLAARKADDAGWLTPDHSCWCYLCRQPHTKAECSRQLQQVPA